jgi:hypothetical protein
MNDEDFNEAEKSHEEGKAIAGITLFVMLFIVAVMCAI